MFVLANYGNRWRMHRRAFHQAFNENVVKQYEPIQLNTAQQLLSSILKAPNNLSDHVKL